MDTDHVSLHGLPLPERARENSRHQQPVFLCFLLAAALSAGGCREPGGVRPEGSKAVELADRLEPVNPVSSGKRFDRHFIVIRNGQRKDALVLMAPVSMQASLRGVAGKMALQGLATPVFNIGDGIQMNVFIRRSGALQAVGSRYFDSGRKSEDRNWIPIMIPLEIRGEDQLEIGVSAGPQGDLVADWLALSSLRLVQREPQP